MKKRHYMGKLRVDIRKIQGIILPSPYYTTFVTKFSSEEEGCVNFRCIQASKGKGFLRQL
jgi:hypothetical protein